MKTKKILILIAVILVIIGGCFAFKYYKNNVTTKLETTFFFSCNRYSECKPINRGNDSYLKVKNAIISFLENDVTYFDGEQSYACGTIVAGYDESYIYAWFSCIGYIKNKGVVEDGSGFGFGRQKFGYKYVNDKFIVTSLDYPKKDYDDLEWKMGDSATKLRITEEDKSNYGKFYDILDSYPVPGADPEGYDEIEKRGMEKAESLSSFSVMKFEIITDINSTWLGSIIRHYL